MREKELDRVVHLLVAEVRMETYSVGGVESGGVGAV